MKGCFDITTFPRESPLNQSAQDSGRYRQSALILVAARLRHVAGTRWRTRRYLDMHRLREQALAEPAAAMMEPLI